MDCKAIKAAEICIKEMELALLRMQNSKVLTEFDAAWSAFLGSAHRIYSKLEQGAKTKSASAAWFGRKRHERKTVALLSYIHHARNVDEHGLSEITEKTPGSVALGVGPGRWRFDGTLGPTGAMTITAMGGQVSGVSKFVEIREPKIRLVQVIDRGIKYDPPKNTDGSDMEPIEAAQLALAHLTHIVEDAKRLSS